MMRFAPLVVLALVGCASAPEEPQDPRCPKHWTWNPDNVGHCNPPDGYAALLYAEFGGSGVYGFGRLTEPCFDGQGSVAGSP